VRRGDIPLSVAPEDSGFEARPFLAHRILGSMMPPSGVAMTWTEAGAGGGVDLRKHATQSLLIVLRGSARLVGRSSTQLNQGDVVMLPSHHEYGLTDVGPGGVQALHVSFGRKAPGPFEDVFSLDALMARNAARASEVMDGPFFALLRSPELKSARKRALYLSAIRVFSDAFQTLMFTRQAMCRDEEFANAFHAHFMEELGHNRFLATPPDERTANDPILRATSSWFCHQMIVLDNRAKLVLVNLVLETAGYHFHTLARSCFGDDVYPNYFDAHSEEAEGHHQDMGGPLLEGQTPETYRRLAGVLEDGWNMFDTMTRHIAHLVGLETTRS
jgi:mannose-6-phosphate isomerase-like protein (cupin superfamily)